MGNHLYSNNRSVKMVFRIFILFCLLTIGAMANQGDSYLDNDESDLLVPFGEPQLIASSRSICCFTQKMCVPVTTTSLTESLSDKPKTEDKDRQKNVTINGVVIYACQSGRIQLSSPSELWLIL